MSKILSRVLVFLIGLPAVLSLVVLFPQMNHLSANIAATIASAIGAMEFSAIIGRKGHKLIPIEAALLGGALPFAALLRVSFGVPYETELVMFACVSLWLLSSRVLSRRSQFQTIVDRIQAGFAVLIYPGALMLWLVRLDAHPQASVLLAVFLLMVFCNDSLAWLTGMLFGDGNRGYIEASPNKSLVGFGGGVFASVIIAFGGAYFFPAAFPHPLLSRPFAAIAFGVTTGFAAIVGDLAESTIKRAADVKDSGTIIPGRGGILDSIDSIALAAPVFLAGYVVLFV